VKFVAIITRTLKNGKTFDDYRKAWFHTNGFGISTQMYTVINAFNPREIISIGILEADSADKLQNALNIDVEERIQHPLDEIIESTIIRNFGMVVSEDDFSANGKLEYLEPAIDGIPTDLNSVYLTLDTVKTMIIKASKTRDERLKDGNNN
jgi:hypothetical protein